MSITPLSVAVIGAGMAGTTHANAWRQVGTVFDLGLPQVRLHTIADAYLPFAEDAAQRYGYERAVDDWRVVAEDPDIDIVSIVVGNALHREIAEALIRAGKHVLCEKPLADTLESARAMARAEKEAGVVTGVGFTYRRNAAVAELAKLVAEGHLGEINHFDGRYWCDYGVDPSTPMAWRYKGPMGSGGPGRRRQSPHRYRRAHLWPHHLGLGRSHDDLHQGAPRDRWTRHSRHRSGRRRLR